MRRYCLRSGPWGGIRVLGAPDLRLQVKVERHEISLAVALLEESINASDRPHAKVRIEDHGPVPRFFRGYVDPHPAERAREDLAQERAVPHQLRLELLHLLLAARVETPAKVTLHRLDGDGVRHERRAV